MASFRSHLEKQGLLYHGEEPAVKAGVLPYYTDGEGARHYLVAAPKAMRNESDMVPFAPARGTRKQFGRDSTGRPLEALDMGRDAFPPGVQVKPESPQSAAIREAREELGVMLRHQQLERIGPVAYKGYGIHLFTADMRRPVVPGEALDSRAVAWMTMNDMRELSQLPVNHADRFNPEYLGLMEAIDQGIEQMMTQRKSRARA